MKPVLKAPGAMLLRLGCDESHSSFASNFNSRRYTKGPRAEKLVPALLSLLQREVVAAVDSAGRRRSVTLGKGREGHSHEVGCCKLTSVL